MRNYYLTDKTTSIDDCSKSYEFFVPNSLFKCRATSDNFKLYGDGDIALYRDIVRAKSATSQCNGVYNSALHHDLYLYHHTKGLVKLESTNEFETLIDILQYYQINEEFLQELPLKSKFKDIKAILKEYDQWKYKKQMEEQNV